MEQNIFDWFQNNIGVSLVQSQYQDIVWFINGELDKENREIRQELERLQGELLNVKEQHSSICDMYQDLVMGVCSKHNGETRHETAFKYIQQAEEAKEEATRVLADKGE